MKAGARSASPPTVTHIIPGETEVLAVASLVDRVYVVRQLKKEVEVYDADTLTLQRSLPVPGISTTAPGIAACARNKCLYLSDWICDSIHRVDLSTDGLKKWPVARAPVGLSVNGDHNVVVTCMRDEKLQEYTTDGRLMREIRLPAGMYRCEHEIFQIKYFNLFCIFFKYFRGQKKQKKQKNTKLSLISFCFTAFYYLLSCFVLVSFTFAAFTG